MTTRKVFSLLQLSTSIRQRIEEATGGRSFWVKAEIAQLDHKRHMYLELVEHRNGARVAVMRAILWQNVLGSVRQELGVEFDNILRPGSEVLCQATVHYSPLYGLSLHIGAVDLAYSLGELERRKQATVATLRAEGLFDLNRSLPEPMVIQRIALITSEGSAAHGDLMRHLRDNEHGYRFHVTLFPAAVQGDGAPRELLRAVEAVDPASFDAIVLVRGGGSKLDLEAFNDLDLCRALARMPIPVMTGIGHDVDISVVDLIAKSPHKTPTAIADHLVDKCLYFETNLSGFLVSMQRVVVDSFMERRELLSGYAELLRQRPGALCQSRAALLQRTTARLTRSATELLVRHQKDLQLHGQALGTHPMRVLRDAAPRINAHQNALQLVAKRGLRRFQEQVDDIHRTMSLLDPERTLARGFSITRRQGRAVTDASELKPGDHIETTFAHGSIRSIIATPEDHG